VRAVLKYRGLMGDVLSQNRVIRDLVFTWRGRGMWHESRSGRSATDRSRLQGNRDQRSHCTETKQWIVCARHALRVRCLGNTHTIY
jgi:hypothetical protein